MKRTLALVFGLMLCLTACGEKETIPDTSNIESFSPAGQIIYAPPVETSDGSEASSLTQETPEEQEDFLSTGQPELTPELPTSDSETSTEDQSTNITTIQPKPTENTAAVQPTPWQDTTVSVTSQPAPTPTPEPAAETPVVQEPAATKDVAAAYIGKSASSMTAAIGEPLYRSYASSCLGDGEDGELAYDGFIVYTYREDGQETVQDVE